MLLLFDVVQEAVAEHDEWHTHEHLPERLSIPGFVRGTRWVALRGQPRYFVMYEVEALATLTSNDYLQRLNHPSPWTSKIMPFYRGMIRGFCSVAGSFGFGTGHAGLLMRFKPAATEAGSSLRGWLLQDILPQLPATPGIGSVHLFERALPPQMTNEQRIRGADAGLDSALLVTGYDRDALAGLMQADLGSAQLEAHGATGVLAAIYGMEYSIVRQEVGA
ncbi:MAG: hypothetical protein IPI40_04990 [Betaproteobacteria bacterium]|jgi:hypothetical protein|nr:hypothetical protein [Betaproteobacteria bacterium]